jgi:predicted ATPase
VACVRWEEIPEELRSLQRRAEAVRMTASGIDLDDPARFCRIMEVEELSDDSMRELIARTLGSSPPERELADRISALACGNPLFAEEITLSLKTVAVYGYARVSTDGQSLAAQLAELKGAKCEKIFQEKISGARSDRKQLAKLMALLAKGDVLVVTRLDRLARSTRDLLNLLGTIGKKGQASAQRHLG